MQIEKFKALHLQFSQPDLNSDILNESLYDEYLEAIENNKACKEWCYINILTKKGFDYSRHCCLDMSYHLSAILDYKEDSPDIIIKYIDNFDEYGIPIHDGGSSLININYCPWCAKKLPESKRDKWFERLGALGYDDPFYQNIPIEFNSDKWYR